MRHAVIIAAGLLLQAIAPAVMGNSFTQVTSNVWLLPGQLQENRSPDGNIEILRGTHGVIVVDTGRNDDHTDALIDSLTQMKMPIAGVFNTHWHLDHIGGNAKLKQQWPDIHIYAHPSLDTALSGFHKIYRDQLETYLPTLPPGSADHQRYTTELELLKLDRLLRETDSIAQSSTMKLAGLTLEVHVSPHSVTEGDVWLYDVQSKTLIAGDLVTLPVPLFDSACAEGWQRSLAVFSKVKFKTLIPGHGSPMNRSAFETYRSAFTDLLQCAQHPENKQQCIDSWFADAHRLTNPDDEAYGRILLSYYFDEFIAPHSAGRKKWCGTA